MHRSSFDKMQAVREAYLDAVAEQGLSVLDVGSASVAADGASYRPLFPPPWRYVGLDMEAGRNVDLVVQDPYAWAEVADASFDVVISGQAFEHIAWPWLTMAEIARVLKVRGVAVITAPSSGPVHRYPLDCWRYYPDGLPALAAFAGLAVIEAHTASGYAYPENAAWGDSFVVLQRPARDPAAERDWATRRRALRVAAGCAPGPEESEAVPVAPIPDLVNQEACARREALRLGELSGARVKLGLLRQSARRLRYVLRSELRQLQRF